MKLSQLFFHVTSSDVVVMSTWSDSAAANYVLVSCVQKPFLFGKMEYIDGDGSIHAQAE